MYFSETEKSGKAVLKLSGDLTIGHVAEAHRTILSATDVRDRLVLDISDVSDCDSAGVQLLASVSIGEVQPGKNIISIEGTSPSVDAAFERLGLQLQLSASSGKEIPNA